MPAPFGPISATHSPASTVADTSSTTGRPPRRTVTPSGAIALTRGSQGAQHEREERSADQRGDDTDRHLRRRQGGARDHVREDQEPGTDHEGQRQKAAVRRSGQHPDGVRDDDPDECDQPLTATAAAVPIVAATTR